MSSQPPKPTTFGKYTLLERISHGGMAEVFRARTSGEAGFEREVAIKLLLPRVAMDEAFVTMLIDEAKIAGQLSHANIAQIFDLGKADDRYFIVQEYVPGRDLRGILRHLAQRKQHLSLAQACHIVLKMCEGLDYAHNKRDLSGNPLNLVHRDISPQNVIVSYEGEIKLIDFGIVKAEGRATRTLAGLVKGKFAYMSPEQIRGLPVDRRSDVFACGIVLHELLTGHPLFKRATEFETLRRARSAAIEAPSQLRPEVPAELDRVALKALARHVDDRYQTAAALRDDLWEFMRASGHVTSREELAAWMQESFPEGPQASAADDGRASSDSGRRSPSGPPPLDYDDSDEDDEDDVSTGGGDDFDLDGDYGDMMTLVDPQLQARFLGDEDEAEDGDEVRPTRPMSAPGVRELARAAQRQPDRAVFTPDSGGDRGILGSDLSLLRGGGDDDEETTSNRSAEGRTEPIARASWVEPQTPTTRRPTTGDPAPGSATTSPGPGPVGNAAVQAQPGLGPAPAPRGGNAAPRSLPGMPPGPRGPAGTPAPDPRSGARPGARPDARQTPAPDPRQTPAPDPRAPAPAGGPVPAHRPTPSPAPMPQAPAQVAGQAAPMPGAGPTPMQPPMPGMQIPMPGAAPLPGPMQTPMPGAAPLPGPMQTPMPGAAPLPGPMQTPMPGAGPMHPARPYPAGPHGAPPRAPALSPAARWRRWWIAGALALLLAAGVASIALAAGT
ncbi:MAG TPA: protein kinase [Kofleriaceae bacterium]|nr:protein kinase [Kofleriaceae bacterium]